MRLQTRPHLCFFKNSTDSQETLQCIQSTPFKVCSISHGLLQLISSVLPGDIAASQKHLISCHSIIVHNLIYHCPSLSLPSTLGLGGVQIWISWGVNVYKGNEALFERRDELTAYGQWGHWLSSVLVTKTKATRIWSDSPTPKYFHPQGWETQNQVKKRERDTDFLKCPARQEPWNIIVLWFNMTPISLWNWIHVCAFYEVTFCDSLTKVWLFFEDRFPFSFQIWLNTHVPINSIWCLQKVFPP